MSDQNAPQSPSDSGASDGNVPPQHADPQQSYGQQPYGQQGYAQQAPPPYVAPAPMLESEARTMAMLVHILAAVAMVLSAGTLAFVVPLVLWLIYRERSALVDFHGKSNLNLQLTSLLVIVGGTILGIVTFGIGLFVTIPAMIAYGIYALIISIIAGVRANRGEYYPIPFVIRFLK